jgi:hypothetical protein
MQARYPENIDLLVEGLVGPLDDDDALRWMRERVSEMHPRITNVHVWSFDFFAAL